MPHFSKTNIDQLGDRLRAGRISDSDLRLLDSFRRSFVPAYQQVIRVIKGDLGHDVTGRPAKSTTSIIEKLRRETIRLTQMQDISGCRLIVPDILAQNTATDRIKEALRKVTVVDRRERPSHGYRAVHLIADVRGQPIEIQVRTTLQHLWAELSEKAADMFDSAIKYGGGPRPIAKILSHYSDHVAFIERYELESMPPKTSDSFNRFKRQVRKSLEELTERTAKALQKRQRD